MNQDRLFISQLSEFKSFEPFLLKKYIPDGVINNLHSQTFIDIINTIIRFINDAKYNIETENKLSIRQVTNSIMGGGKSTALQIVSKMMLEQSDVPLLLVFNKEKSMENVLEPVAEYARSKGMENGVKMITSRNYDDYKDNIHQYKVVGITQQRLRDIATGSGDYSVFHSYHVDASVGWSYTTERIVIVDEMPIFFDSEIFDIGEFNNSVDWFNEGMELIDESKMSRKDIQRARLVINNIFALEMLEATDNDVTSISTRKLGRSIEGSPQYDVVLAAINQFKEITLTPKSHRRFTWFQKLFFSDSVGVINRDGKMTNIYCSKFIDYKQFGHMLILDGTSSIVNIFYDHGKFEYIHNTNYHNYKDRLKIYFVDVSTSKESRKKDDTHLRVTESLLEFKKIGEKSNLKILALPLKGDIQKYVENGVINESERQKYFTNKVDSESNTAISLLNSTGDNDINKYDGIALLSLPVRHPSYYKLQAIGLHGTSIDISLKQGKPKKDSLEWFSDEKVQKVYESLVLMDLSQIIHRTRLRNMSDNSKAFVFIYTNKLGWLECLKMHYKLPDSSIAIYSLKDETELRVKVKERLQSIQNKLKDLDKFKKHSIGKIDVRFKKWINEYWDDKHHQKIIIEEFERINWNVFIDDNGWKYIKHK